MPDGLRGESVAAGLGSATRVFLVGDVSLLPKPNEVCALSDSAFASTAWKPRFSGEAVPGRELIRPFSGDSESALAVEELGPSSLSFGFGSGGSDIADVPGRELLWALPALLLSGRLKGSSRGGGIS